MPQSYTYSEAYDAMLALFKSAWDPTGHRVFWDNKEKGRETDTSTYAVVQVNYGGANQASLGGTGNRTFKRNGVVLIMIYAQAGEGLSEGHAAAKVAADAFEGQASGGIWFRNVRINEIGREGSFYQINVLAEFEYDEIK